jgi:hypothetical protein
MARESAVLKAVRGILNLSCQHPRLALGAARALDRKKFWIRLSHGGLAENRTVVNKIYDPRAKGCLSGTRHKNIDNNSKYEGLPQRALGARQVRSGSSASFPNIRLKSAFWMISDVPK